MKISTYIALLFLTIACVKTNKYSENLQDINILNHWHVKDYEKDSIPGISLEKLYNVLLKDRQGKEVIVAVIDTEIDINHEDLKDYIWLNADEIPENGKDEDGNGYVDDIHGWNYIGNTKGENLISAQFSFLRKLISPALLHIKTNNIIPGKTPKLTISAKLSSSFPIGEETFNNLAAVPSKKSKTNAAAASQTTFTN